MHFPDEPGNVKQSDALHQWARLESKSDSMAEQLVQNVQFNRRSKDKPGRYTNAIVLGSLLTFCIGVTIAILRSRSPTEPPETSLSRSSEVRQPTP